MAEHPAEDLLFDLALGDVSEPDQDALTDHLASCSQCRLQYDAITTTLDHALAAAPRIQPTPGFDRKVLETMGLGPEEATADAAQPPASPGTSRPRWWRRPTMLAAAACLVGAVLGVGGAMTAGVLTDDDAPPATLAWANATLTTAAGEPVGTVSLSRYGEREVMIISAAGGREGVQYECRVELADGSSIMVGEWPVPDDGASWVVPAPEIPSVRVDLVDTSAGVVWSTATF